MIEYSAGLLFSEDRRWVALVEKQKPDWQRGKLNAIGGKIESGETPHDCMVREFAEEAGVQIDRWESVVVLTGSNFVVYFFAAFSDLVHSTTTMEAERIVRRGCSDGHVHDGNLIPNLAVIIPIALDRSGIQKPVMLYDEIPNVG